MAERSTQKLARNNNSLSDKNFRPSYQARSGKPSSISFNPDEVISTLSQSYENRRAVQAFAWEAIRLGGAYHRSGTT